MRTLAFVPRDGNVPRDAHPNIWMLVHYWKYIQPMGRLPGANHFNLDDIPALLPNMRLLDVVDGAPYRYRIRMIGKDHVKQLGYDPTGAWYETITSRFRDSVVELDLTRVCHAQQPVYRKGRTIVPYASDSKIIERVHVPLASNGTHVDCIASVTLFFPELRSFAGSRPTAGAAQGSRDIDLASPPPGLEQGIALPQARADVVRDQHAA